MNTQELRNLSRSKFADTETLARDLAKIPSTTPPSDTREIIDFVNWNLEGIPGVDIEIKTEVEPIANLIATVKGNGPGKRLLLNGHLDTFEVVDEDRWEHPPFGGDVENRRLYGVGISDMKAGCAVLIETFKLLATHRSEWNGEVVLTLVGGEESGGHHGTEFLLKTDPRTKADACLITDVGTSRVIRFGEKGRYRFLLMAEGIAGHGAHAHKTLNANELLIDAIVKYREAVRKLVPDCPERVTEIIKSAKEVSESIAGKGETHTLLNPTINIGILKGGTAPNLVPSHAEALIDTRLPVGIQPEQIEEILNKICKEQPRITYKTQMICESLYSDPDHPLAKELLEASSFVHGKPSATTIRVGGTDAKHVRRFGIPSYVCGVEGGRMGAPDEFVDFDELDNLLEIVVIASFKYLQK